MIKSDINIKQIIFAYIKSMRPYMFFVSGIAGWLGIVFSGVSTDFFVTIVILSIMFIGWGVNQVINDILGIKEDRINAPYRPIVTKELPLSYAIYFSFSLFILGGIVSFLLNPQALIIYCFIFILNIIYEYSKALPVLGNIVFGFLIVPCLYYGAMCSNGKGLEILLDKQLFLLATVIYLVNFALCYYTYFKDYTGDRQTGKNTIIVLLKPFNARYLNFIISLIPFIVMYYLFLNTGWLNHVNIYFLVLCFFSFILLQLTAYLFFKYPEGSRTFFSLKWNYIGTVLFQVSFIAFINPFLSITLYIFSFSVMYLLFDLQKNHLA